MWVTFLEGYSALAALSLSASTVSLHEYKIIPKTKHLKSLLNSHINVYQPFFVGCVCGNYSLYSALPVSPGLHLRSLAR